MSNEIPKVLPVEDELDDAELREKILQLRIEGKPRKQIVKDLDISISVYQRVLQKAATETVTRNADLVDEMFLVHYRRLEDLYARTIDKIATSEFFDVNLIKTALSILERQSKLLGLDRDREKTGSGSRGGRVGDNGDRYAWMNTATPADIMAEAAKLGIQVPPGFELLPPKPVS